MTDNVQDLPTVGELVDITTTGRKSGEARRIEIRLHVLDGRFYLSGRPGNPRSWLANMAAHPEMTLHLKQAIVRDVPSTAAVISDADERRRVFALMLEREERMSHVDVDVWAATAPLVELTPV